MELLFFLLDFANYLVYNITTINEVMMKRSAFEKIFWDSVDAGINPHPDTYTEEELCAYNPAVPRWFIKQHVAKRDAKKKPGC